MRLYNTLTREKDELKTIEPNKVKLYVCGPTVYDYSHLGHARCYVIYDVLVRYLRASGKDVLYVRNVTDVDDKILNRAAERQEEPEALAERFYQAYREDMTALGNLDPDIEPKVTEHMDEILTMITTLIDRGHAYESGGSVYFDVQSNPEYGKLSHRRLADMVAGASERTEDTESADKKHPFDFALWKNSTDSSITSWSSPWGEGRPGWHIECSAMSSKYLGETFDLHGGGLDLVFPHHENEIAQSECASGKPYVNHWMHNGFVQVNKEKMSKSLGNFFVIRQAFELHEPEALRFALLSMHYRSPLNLDWDLDDEGQVTRFPQFAEAEQRIERLYLLQVRLSQIGKKRWSATGEIESSEELRLAASLHEALSDDLNTPVALAKVEGFLKKSNEVFDRIAKGAKAQPDVKEDIESSLKALRETLGFGGDAPAEVLSRIRDRRAKQRGVDPEKVRSLLEERTQARVNKDFAKADEIRDQLSQQGVELLDGPSGTDWRLPA